MKEKEFRRLSRAELVEIIYQLQQNNQSLEEENSQLREKLNSKEINISQAGSIAEAAIGLSGVFAKAQEAADLYLAELHRSNAELEKERNAILADAKQRASEMLRKAEKAANAKIQAATMESEKLWKDVNEKVDQLIRSQEALKWLLK